MIFPLEHGFILSIAGHYTGATIMRSNALYFPYIALPNETWTIKSLLYWDKLSAIVPLDYLERPGQMGDFMRELLTEGLVEPVTPGQYIHRIRRFDENFIQLIEHRLRRRRRDDRPTGPMSRIHAEKLGEIPDFLVNAGLARRVAWNWYNVESITANLFMAYLAVCLGAIPEVDATPVTNQVAFARFLQPGQWQMTRYPVRRQEIRDVVLDNLLPAPAGPVDVAMLLRFKRRHSGRIRRFRTIVEAHCSSVATLRAASDRSDANAAFLQDCEQHIAEIKESMQRTFGQVILGSLAPLFGAGLTVQATDTGNAIAYAGSALTLAGAAYLAIASVQGSRAIRDRPLAYIAHARQTFGGI
jgi:hypothetical protein